ETDADPDRALRALRAPAARVLIPDAALESLRCGLLRAGVRGLPFGSPRYPRRLAILPDAPPLLLFRGSLAFLERPGVALVGARDATASGCALAQRLARDLVGLGFAVISGLARGIDAAAHRGALEAGGPTAAVLGCGPDRVYPARHARLGAEVVARGALLSELPPGTPPLPHHFPLRNRIISALCRAVVVVEARPHSGSLITARHALDQGRELLVVPGPVGAPPHEGSNRLLREHAHVLLEALDVPRALEWSPVPDAVEAPRPPADPVARAILAALGQEPASRDELAARLGLAAAALDRALLPLELEGRVVGERDGRLRVVA
ncbi:MAG: DNA-processing protein DprA, partial [Myxococcota bacterium]|nr:DNA-processing protein DprA [Myxococcota bacterium]